MIQITANSVNITNQINQGTLNVRQKITNQVDTADFIVAYAGSKTYEPEYGDIIEIWDGAHKIFAGTVVNVQQQPLTRASGIWYRVKCVDWGYELDRRLVSRSYANATIHDIIADIVSSYAPGFTTNNVTSTFLIRKIVFNQVPISVCLKRLASVVNYDWYVDEDKDVHFFAKYTNSAPFDVTDQNGNYIYSTLSRNKDGTQVTNRVKVRGGLYNGSTFTDIITVVGNDTKSFKLPYGFAELQVELDTGSGFTSQSVGIDFIDDFGSKDVLYNYSDQMIRWENNLADGNQIRFTGFPKVPVFAVAEDPVSIAEYGVLEKLIRDTTIESNEVARRRANAELYSYAEPVIDASFSTYTPGLRAGQIIRIQSDLQNIDEELIIKEVSFGMRDHDNFKYNVSLVSTKRYDFINLLQALLEPDPRPDDDKEVAEEIYTDTQTVTIDEETEAVAYFEDDSQITAQENYEIDPFGPGENAIYVLSPYSPMGQDDPKRPGRLDISLVVY